eukprot:11152113-Ditylum_brightwellii.AAC.1
MVESASPDTTGSGALVLLASCYKTMKNTGKTGNVIIKKETCHELEFHQCHSYYEGVVKGLPRKFHLLSLTKLEKQLESVITSTTNVRKVCKHLEHQDMLDCFMLVQPTSS